MPITTVAFNNTGQLFHQSRAVITDKGDDVGSFHQFDSTFTGSGIILPRIRGFQKVL
jgi:hypothetical protein